MLGIDFVGQRRITMPGILLFIMGIAGLLSIAMLHEQTKTEVAQWEGRLSHYKHPASVIHNSDEQKITPSDLAYMNEVLKRLNLPWDSLFQVFEKTAGEQVTLTSLQPEAAKETIRIGGEASNLYAVLRYLEELQKQSFFSEVNLVEHEIAQKAGQKPVRFQIVARWKLK